MKWKKSDNQKYIKKFNWLFFCFVFFIEKVLESPLIDCRRGVQFSFLVKNPYKSLSYIYKILLIITAKCVKENATRIDWEFGYGDQISNPNLPFQEFWYIDNSKCPTLPQAVW